MAGEGGGRLVLITPSTRVITPPIWLVRGLALGLLLVAAFMVVAQPAEAKKAKCWERLVQDWFEDSRIDGVYPARCYSDALKYVSEDILIYSSFEEDARDARLQNVRRPASVGTPTTTPRRGPQSPDSASPNARPDDGLFKEAFDELGPQNADSMPLPLMILGGLALLLIAGGAAGLIARRLRGRRAPA